MTTLTLRAAALFGRTHRCTCGMPTDETGIGCTPTVCVHAEQRAFRNRLCRLHGIEMHDLPATMSAQRRAEFVRSPVREYLRLDDETEAAVWGLVAGRERVA